MRVLIGAATAAGLIAASAIAGLACSGGGGSRSHVGPRSELPAYQTSGSGGLERLRVTPADGFVTAGGTPVRIIGTNLQPVFEPRSPRTWPPEVYRGIKEKGFTAVRFVLFWDMFEPQRNQYNETAFRTLDKAVGLAGDAGLYVIMDVIHLSGDPAGMEHVPVWARGTGTGGRR
jgi:hypothetical protein